MNKCRPFDTIEPMAEVSDDAVQSWSANSSTLMALHGGCNASERTRFASVSRVGGSGNERFLFLADCVHVRSVSMMARSRGADARVNASSTAMAKTFCWSAEDRMFASESESESAFVASSNSDCSRTRKDGSR